MYNNHFYNKGDAGSLTAFPGIGTRIPFIGRFKIQGSLL
jgi:hypothetical protein